MPKRVSGPYQKLIFSPNRATNGFKTSDGRRKTGPNDVARASTGLLFVRLNRSTSGSSVSLPSISGVGRAIRKFGDIHAVQRQRPIRQLHGLGGLIQPSEQLG